MKVRQGFVSNSSSSSFLVGVAQLENPNKFKLWCLKNKVPFDRYDGVHIVSFDNLQREIEDNYLFDIDWAASGSSFNLTKKYWNKVDPNAMFVFFEIINSEGDQEFYEDGGGDINYDIVFNDDFFTDYEKALLKAFNKTCEEAGLIHGKSSYGAGRNG